MNSRDLNSINEAFVQATTRVVAEDTKKEKKSLPPIFKKDEEEEVKEDLGPDFGDEGDFGDASRHSGDYLDDEPLDVGDIVEVEGESDDFVVLGIDGEWVQAAAVGDGIEVKRDSVVKADGARDYVPPHDEDKLGRAKERGYESVKVEKRLVTLKEKKKVMKYTNIMDEFESRLSTSSRGF